MPKQRSSGPTLREIAMRAGVTHVTVSLSLRDDPRVSAATRTRIKALAETMGYRPDPELQRLMHYLREKKGTGFAGTLVYLNFSQGKRQPFAGSYILSILKGARVRADQLGYQLEEFWCGAPNLSPARAADILEARGARGVLIPPLHRGISHSDFRLDRFATALLTHSVANNLPGLNRVVPNQQDDMRRLYAHLLSRGHRCIGLVASRDILARMHDAPLAHAMALPVLHRGVKVPPPFLYEDFSEFDRLPAWFKKTQPDVLVVPHAWEFRLACREMGWEGFKTVVNAAYGGTADDIIHIYQDPTRIGAAGVDLIAAAIQRNEVGLPRNPKIVLIDGEVREPSAPPLWEASQR